MRRFVLLAALAAFAGGAGPPAPPALAQQPRALTPGVAVERPLTAGEVHLYEVDLAPGRPWRFTVVQRGVDVTLVLASPGGSSTVEVDSPLDRRGRETLVVRPGIAGRHPLRHRLEVRSREAAAPPGRYVLRLEALPATAADDRRRLAAETARSQAAEHYAAGRRREALGGYREALALWPVGGDGREAARDLYCVAVLERLVGDTDAALASARRALAAWQALGDREWQAPTWNEIGLSLWNRGDNDEARGALGHALGLYRALGDRTGQVKSRNNLCLTFLTAGETRRALDCYPPLLEVLDAEAEPLLAATVHANLGWAYDTLGEPDPSAEHYRRSLALMRRAGDAKGEAQVVNNLARLRRRLGDFDAALDGYRRALELARSLDDDRLAGRALNNLGYVYALLGEPGRASTFFQSALELRRRTADRRGEVHTLNNLGRVHRRSGEPGRALPLHRRALEVARELADPRLEGASLVLLGWTHLELGDAAAALARGGPALQRFRAAGDRSGEAEATLLLGRGELLRGDPSAAADRLRRAAELAAALRDPSGEAEARTALAEAEDRRGRLGVALSEIEAALGLLESMRGGLASHDLRATFLGTRRRTHELHVEVLMSLHRAEPDAGHDRRALTASEAARARALLDLLAEAGAEPERGVAPALAARRSAALRRLAAKAERQRRLLAGEPSPAAATAESEIAEALQHLEAVEAEIRAGLPRYAALTRPTVDHHAIRALLEPDTVLLEFWLGDRRSYLWRVTAGGVESHELPPRSEIEASVLGVHARLGAPGPADRRRQAAELASLGRLLLGPVAGGLGTGRLVVVPDGALHFLPFAALTVPGEGEPLGARRTMVHLPSASVLTSLRRRLAHRPPAPGVVALLADPVFDRADRRLRGVVPAPGTVRAGAADGAYRRLPFSRREAESIVALARGEALLALDFEASRDTVVGGRLAGYRVVHLATHAVVDTETPRLSGLVLSRFGEDGRPRPGFVSLADLYALDLAADLVVLSGCRTALGRQVRGEGLIGLVRGFMDAGAPRVVASLWPVEDRATAELMLRFYRSLWNDDLPPAEALAAARQSMRREPRWQDPYYWAGFVLVGEWR